MSNVVSLFYYCHMQAPRIRVNVSGRVFELTQEAFTALPLLANAPRVEGEELFIARSPLVFEHVLALVLDPLHPFPAAYAYELDYWGVEYDFARLQDPLGLLLHDVSLLNEKVAMLRLGEIAFPLPTVKTRCLKHVAHGKLCGNDATTFEPWCVTHRTLCCETLCVTFRAKGSNQCIEHRERSAYCFVDRCTVRRIDHSLYCPYHAEIWSPKKVTK